MLRIAGIYQMPTWQEALQDYIKGEMDEKKRSFYRKRTKCVKR